MKLSNIVRRRLSIAVLVMGLLFSAAACEGKPTPPVVLTSTPTPAPAVVLTSTAAPTPTVLPTPIPTPTPIPELTLNDLLSSAGDKLADLTTAKFQMTDEMESGAQFFRTTLKNVEGEIKAPDSVRMLVDVEAPSMGFVEIEILAVKDLAYIKFSKDAPWVALPLDQVPFNFGGIGVTLSALLPIVRDAAIAGRESVEGSQTIRINGNVVSEDLSNLITSVDSGHPITLTFWFDEDNHTLRQLRIAGKLFNGDAPETSRLVIISDLNGPVDIQLPDITTEQ